jgi:hypothetical protein
MTEPAAALLKADTHRHEFVISMPLHVGIRRKFSIEPLKQWLQSMPG